MIIVALQSVSFMKISKILPDKFTLKYWIYLLDLLINTIKNRFEREDYKRYVILENLLLKYAKNESYADEFETVFSIYSEFQ